MQNQINGKITQVTFFFFSVTYDNSDDGVRSSPKSQTQQKLRIQKPVRAPTILKMHTISFDGLLDVHN